MSNLENYIRQLQILMNLDQVDLTFNLGKYRLADCFQEKEEYYAPFLSTCGRAEKKKKFITPGPGNVDVI